MRYSSFPAWRFGLRIALPALGVLAGTIVTVLVSLNQMAGVVNRTEDRLNHRSVEAAVQTVLRRMGQSHRDYAEWDAAARNLYGTINPDFVRETFNGSSSTQTFFDTAYILDEEGRVLTAVRRGQATDVPLLDAFGPAFASLMQGIADDGRTYEVRTGFVSGVWGLMAVAVGPIVPEAIDFPEPRRSRYLVFAKPIDNTSIDFIAEEYQIDGLRLVKPSEATADSIDLADPAGTVEASLTWTPGTLGTDGHAHVGPAVHLMLGLIVLTVMALILIAMRGLDQIRQGEDRVRHTAGHDALTGLPNRATLLHRLDETIAAIRRGRAKSCLIFLDLDGFKDVNDSYGHAVGDKLLRHVSAGLQMVTGDRMAARVGGDEFAILSREGETVEAATDLGRLVIRYFAQPFDIDGRIIFIGTSIGIAEVDPLADKPEEILRRADIAMYQAKEQGRNRIVAYEPSFDAERQERVDIAADLGVALRNGELELAYQPVFDADQRRIVGAEALLRWTRNGKEVVPARVFVPIAEETGLIDDLGAWVLRQACRDAGNWQDIYVAVNVSPAQLRNPNFEFLVQRVLAESGLQANRLELEVTETYLISNPVAAGQSINAIRNLGVSMALDDFGTGYSSIGYLRSFAFDKMKLDRSLLAGIGSDQRAQRFVQATIALADSLGIGVVAEGVESEEEALLLRVAGCREFQGFHFAMPCPADELSRLLEAQAESEERSSAVTA